MGETVVASPEEPERPRKKFESWEEQVKKAQAASKVQSAFLPHTTAMPVSKKQPSIEEAQKLRLLESPVDLEAKLGRQLRLVDPMRKPDPEGAAKELEGKATWPLMTSAIDLKNAQEVKLYEPPPMPRAVGLKGVAQVRPEKISQPGSSHDPKEDVPKIPGSEPAGTGRMEDPAPRREVRPKVIAQTGERDAALERVERASASDSKVADLETENKILYRIVARQQAEIERLKIGRQEE